MIFLNSSVFLPSTCTFLQVCGACSTAQDLASYMRYSIPDPQTAIPNLATLGFLCHLTITSTNPGISPKDLVDGVSQCLQYGGNLIMIPAANLSAVRVYCSFLTHWSKDTEMHQTYSCSSCVLRHLNAGLCLHMGNKCFSHWLTDRRRWMQRHLFRDASSSSWWVVPSDWLSRQQMPL